MGGGGHVIARLTLGLIAIIKALRINGSFSVYFI